MNRFSKSEVRDVLNRVEQVVIEEGDDDDLAYFTYHKQRYFRMAASLQDYHSDKELAILNMGSHYLHVSLLFQFLGYKVDSMDVVEFWDLEFVKARAKTYELNAIIDNNFETLDSMNGIENKYDIILFTEILEHITFNPIMFWKKIYNLLNDGGLIYISTPNSMCLANIVKSIARILSFRGIGIPVNAIFNTVTYGHHWKEYCSSEIKRYFKNMSDDFHVKIKLYHYKKVRIDGINAGLTALLNYLGNKIFLSEDIEAVVKVDKKGSWKLDAPKY